jgi:hypothetical protein
MNRQHQIDNTEHQDLKFVYELFDLSIDYQEKRVSRYGRTTTKMR